VSRTDAPGLPRVRRHPGACHALSRDQDRPEHDYAERRGGSVASEHRHFHAADFFHRPSSRDSAAALARQTADRRAVNRGSLSGIEAAARGVGSAKRGRGFGADRANGGVTQMKPTRREVLASFAGAAMPRLSRPLVMGFIYNGPKNDLGYNQSHADGKQALRVLPWVKAVEEASVPETVAAEESMRDMIFQDGASVIFATSFGHYDPFTIDVARENPRVQFFHCGGLYEEGKHPKNI